MVQKLPSLQSERIVSQWIPCVLCWWGQLVFFQGLSLLTKTYRDESENQSIRQCLSQDNAPIKPRLQQQPPPPSTSTLGHLTVVLSKRWGTWTLSGWGGQFIRNPQFWPRETGIWMSQSLKVQMPRGFSGRRGGWSFLNWSTLGRQENDSNWNPR